eukprot:s4063_g5.t1
MQPSEIQMEPESTLQKQLQSHIRCLCHFLKAHSTGCQLEGSKREYEGSRHLGWVERKRTQHNFCVPRFGACVPEAFSNNFNNKHCEHCTKVCTPTPWEHRFATALPFQTCAADALPAEGELNGHQLLPL